MLNISIIQIDKRILYGIVVMALSIALQYSEAAQNLSVEHVRAIKFDIARLNLLSEQKAVFAALDLPVSLNDKDNLARLVDKTFSDRYGKLTFTEALSRVMERAETPEANDDHRLDIESSLYDRVLLDRWPIIIRWIPGVDDPKQPSENNEFLTRYQQLATIWAEKLDEYQQLKNHNATEEQIDHAKAQLDLSKMNWDNDGNRAIMTVLLQRRRATGERNPGSLWGNARNQFATRGGLVASKNHKSAPISIYPEIINLQWQHLDIDLTAGGEIQLRYALAFVYRPWLDHDTIFLRPWRWSNGTEFPTNQPLSDGLGCDSSLPLPCLTERVVIASIMDSDGSFSPPVVIATVQSPLPKLPPEFEDHYEEKYTSGWHPHPRHNVSFRLRNGTF
ncbi:hypothetical protein RO575_22685 [Methylomonas sp. MO1]|uniref:hypothetical protein n=1 Tax=Methylomonas sp. MO1 TaxID=3073619 RepID=UPI0028A55E9B|nr:hypothetical protein [Methylomonas sp. MO1]MDT4292382.1 hypothetical protein [Methylomonas sp. MO1]